MPRAGLPFPGSSAFNRDSEMASDQARLDAFRQRQRHDLKRFDHEASGTIHRKSFHGNEFDYHQQADISDDDLVASSTTSASNGWRDSEGDRLDDFGVDEDADFCGDDEIPLAELLRRNRAKSSSD